MEHDQSELNQQQPPPENSAAEGEVVADAPAPHRYPRGGYLLGAPPSNTAPANYTDTSNLRFQPLRWGVDSLYLSYKGDLSPEWSERLQMLKDAARSKAESQQALAQVQIGEQLFEVKPKGRGKFAFVLVDNCFQICIAGNGAHSLPMAYVQVSSELLTAAGVLKAENLLGYVIRTLGKVVGSPRISRADLYVDFTTDAPIHNWSPHCWVTRADRLDTHLVRRQFSGWSIGMGGSIGARLYDKTLEIQKSKKDYLKHLWRDAGWQAEQKVWRLEFQFKRPVLIELGVIEIPALLNSLSGLWRYATENWLRLTIPLDNDTNQTRWPSHPLWLVLGDIDWNTPSSPTLVRVRTARVPSDNTLFVNGLAPITSFMARENISDFQKGVHEFFTRAADHHNLHSPNRDPDRNFSRYIKKKVAIKGKKYSTVLNKNSKNDLVTKNNADAYRKLRDGE